MYHRVTVPMAPNTLTPATSPTRSRSTAARPFLKWAGGKRQLLPQLRRFVPSSFNAYHEPFFGSGAVFFDLRPARSFEDRPVRLADTNADLIGCYKAVAADVGAVIHHLKELEASHLIAPADHYYRVRDERFNPARRGRLASGDASSPDLAAMFIYLNRTGFNGLFRLNSRGEFNVPVGRYTNPKICDEVNLTAVADALNGPKVQLVHGPFASVLAHARARDFVYFDPPYAPLSATASFTSYTATRFSDDNQRELQQVIIELAARGCFVVLSNSTAPIIAELYDGNEAALRAGLRAHSVPARRAINSDASRRGVVMEYIITNVTPS